MAHTLVTGYVWHIPWLQGTYGTYPGYRVRMAHTLVTGYVWHIPWQYPGVAWPGYVFGFAVSSLLLPTLSLGIWGLEIIFSSYAERWSRMSWSIYFPICFQLVIDMNLHMAGQQWCFCLTRCSWFPAVYWRDLSFREIFFTFMISVRQGSRHTGDVGRVHHILMYRLHELESKLSSTWTPTHVSLVHEIQFIFWYPVILRPHTNCFQFRLVATIVGVCPAS